MHIFVDDQAARLFSVIMAVGGTWLISSTPANATPADRVSFRSFREQNSNLDRHAARQMFRSEQKLRSENRPVAASRPIMQSPAPSDGRVSARLADRIGVNSIERVRNQSLQSSSEGTIRLSTGVNLDLTSQEQNIVLGKNLFSGVSNIEISVDGQTKTLSAGSRVTAAEYVAVKQVLNGNAQSVSINKNGAAIGGSIDLSALTVDNDVMRAAKLVVASRVTTYGDFGRKSDFRLSGDLVNYGNIQALSSNSSVRGGAIHADDIVNNSGASIRSTVDLTLDAAGSLINSGSIESDQGLTLSAGRDIQNHGNISANRSIAIGSSSVTNSGIVQSATGNINLDTPSDLALNVNNMNGTMSAVKGTINLRSASFAGTSNSTISGGDLLSQELNLNSGAGLATVEVNELTGLVNETGTAAHVAAATEDLQIGSVCLTGDPTFYNSAGNISITNNLTVAEALVIAASGDITSANSINILAQNTTQGFDITLIAGADITPGSGADSPTIPPGTQGGISLSGSASKTGGRIDLGTGVSISSESSDNTGADNAGNIAMFAFAGKNAGSGLIDLSGNTVTAAGKNGGANGNITLVAGAKSGPAITTGKINNSGGAAGTGVTTMITSQPVTSIKKTPVTYSETGQRTSSSQLVPTSKLTAGNILIGDNGAGIDLQAGSVIAATAGNDLTIAGDVASTSVVLGAINNIVMPAAAAPISAGNVTLRANGSIGSESASIRFDSGAISAAAEGDVYVSSSNAGVINVTQSGAGNFFSIDVPNGTLVTTNGIQGPSIRTRVFNTTNLFIEGGNESYSFTTLDPNFDALAFEFGGTKSLTLDIAGDLGSIANPLKLSNIGTANLKSGGDVIVVQDSKKSAVFTLDAANDAVIVASTGSLTLANATAGGDFKAGIQTKGTLKVTGDITAKDLIEIRAADTSGKISFSSGVTVKTTAKTAGLGDVTISVGATGSPLPNTPANVNVVETGGDVTFTGSGLKAKAPVNTVTALGADVNINNGSKSSNISFGGDVSITADPPVAAGTPTFYSSGGIRYRGQTSTSPQSSNTQTNEAGNLSGAVTTKFFSPLESRLFVNPMLNLNLLPVAGASRLAPHETIVFSSAPDSDDSAGN